MTKQPFWVITARCDNGNNGWDWWIVCVQTAPEDAARIKATLEEQRDRYVAMRRPLFEEAVRFANEPRELSNEEYKNFMASEKQALERVVSEIGMLDLRFRWVRRDLEVPEYQIEESSDDPHTVADPDDPDAY